MELNWSGWWFRFPAADILKAQISASEDQPWDHWGQAIELKLAFVNNSMTMES